MSLTNIVVTEARNKRILTAQFCLYKVYNPALCASRSHRGVFGKGGGEVVT